MLQLEQTTDKETQTTRPTAPQQAMVKVVYEPAPPASQIMTGGEIVARTLSEIGITHIFSHAGGSIIPIHNELEKRRESGLQTPRKIMCADERGAGFMVEGFGKSTGRPAMALATSGPGATNLITPLKDAQMDSVPGLYITGQVHSAKIGTHAFQEADILSMTFDAVLHSYRVMKGNELESIIRQAHALTTLQRPGPVLIDICANTLYEKAEYTGEMLPFNKDMSSPKMDEDIAEKILQMLTHAKKPVIHIGGGVNNTAASEYLRAIIKEYKIPVTSTLLAQGVIDSNDPMFLGMVGMHGTVRGNYALSNADFILAIGTRFNDRVNVLGFGEHAQIAHVDIDRTEFGKVRTAKYSLQSRGENFLQFAQKWLQENGSIPKDREAWLEFHQKNKKKEPTYKQEGPHIIPQHAISVIAKYADKDAIIVTDVGQHQMWTAQHFKYTHPRQLITAGGFGTMGFGLPAAIGAYFGNPDKQIILISGDGSFKMNMPELEVVEKYRIPIKTFIMDNACLGMVTQWENMYYDGNNHETCNQRTVDCDANCTALKEQCRGRSGPDYANLSALYHGISSLRISSPSKLDTMIKHTLESDVPTVADIWTKKDSTVFPMIPPGKGIAEMKY